MMEDERKEGGRKRAPLGKLEQSDVKAIGSVVRLPKMNTIVKDRLIEAAATMDDATPDITYQHSILCQTSLPYRNPGDGVTEWSRDQGRASLFIQAKPVKHPETGAWVKLGVPWGPKARLVLMHLNQEAVRTQSARIEVGDSLTSFVKRIGLTTDGRTIRSIKDQVGLLSGCMIHMAFLNEDASGGVQDGYSIVRGFDLWFPKDERQMVLWPSEVNLSLDYFESLTRHAVPLDERAVGALSHSAMALDIYAWLAHRLHRIRKPHRQFIPWPALQQQFGPDYARLRKFREVFMEALRQVHAVYRAAKISVTGQGLLLYTSPPPIAKTGTVARLPEK